MSKCVYLQNSDAERNFSPEIVRLKVSFSSPMGHWPQPVYCLVVSPALEKRKYTIDSGNYDEPSLTTINMLLNSYSGMHKIWWNMTETKQWNKYNVIYIYIL